MSAPSGGGPCRSVVEPAVSGRPETCRDPVRAGEAPLPRPGRGSCPDSARPDVDGLSVFPRRGGASRMVITGTAAGETNPRRGPGPASSRLRLPISDRWGYRRVRVRPYAEQSQRRGAPVGHSDAPCGSRPRCGRHRLRLTAGAPRPSHADAGGGPLPGRERDPRPRGRGRTRHLSTGRSTCASARCRPGSGPSRSSSRPPHAARAAAQRLTAAALAAGPPGGHHRHHLTVHH